MDVPPTLPKKKDVLEALLADSNVFLHLDPRRDGVVVPRWFQNQPELTLQVGLNMPVPIRDLEIDENGVSCTLSFSRSPFWCSLPWSAIFAIVSEPDRRGGIWPEDVPPDGNWGKSFRAPASKRERPKLAAVPSLEEEPDRAEDAPPPVIGEDSKCGACGTKWIEDQSTCPVCGASISEMVGGPEAAAPPPPPPSEKDARAPVKPVGKPVLAPAPAPAPDRPVLVRKKGGRPAPVAADDKRRRGEKPKAVPRPKLAPAPAADPPAADPAPERAAAERVSPEDVPQAPPSAGSRAPASAGKKTTKRELPPYLRVVK
ncbi:MAG: hypothetical protein U0414_35835 [Polyangiaceae bacterium]